MRSHGDASRAVDRKDTFVKLAAACGVTAMGGMLAFPGQHADAAFTEP